MIADRSARGGRRWSRVVAVVGGALCSALAPPAQTPSLLYPQRGSRVPPGLLPPSRVQDPDRRAEQSPLTPQPTQLRPGFQGLETVYPLYPGFPTYPKGFGPVPRVSGYLPAERSAADLLGLVPPPAILPEDRRTGWPAWMQVEIEGEERAATPERAVLARTADRVWYLAPEEPAFVPLAFHDKFRLLEAGVVIEVRNKGEFQIAFHDGALLRSCGAVRIAVDTLDEIGAEIELRNLRRVWLEARQRPMTVRMPDGSALRIEAAAVYLEADRGRAFVQNSGPSPVRWSGRTGEVEIAPSHRLNFLVTPATRPYLGAELSLEGAVQTRAVGRVIEIEGVSDGGFAVWSGARVRVDSGVVVRLDPLIGSEFPEK